MIEASFRREDRARADRRLVWADRLPFGPGPAARRYLIAPCRGASAFLINIPRRGVRRPDGTARARYCDRAPRGASTCAARLLAALSLGGTPYA